MKEVVIVGMGWLGTALAQTLQQQGWQVQGTVRTQEKAQQLQQAGYRCTPLHLGSTQTSTSLNCSHDAPWIITIPPKSDTDYPKILQQAVQLARQHCASHLIFTGSTSVYADTGTHDETSTQLAHSPRALRMLAAEKTVITANVPRITYFRFGGLIGPDRHPGNFWRQDQLPQANLPINLVHQEDCIHAIIAAIEQQTTAMECFNLCAPTHPSRLDFYQKARIQLSQPPLQTQFSDQRPRIIQGDKITRCLQYVYRWPDLLAWLDLADIYGYAQQRAG